MWLSCRRNLKQDFGQSANSADAQKRSYFSPVRCRQEVLFALWECRNSDSETSGRRGIMHDFIASDGPDRLDLRVLGGYREQNTREFCHCPMIGGPASPSIEHKAGFPS
jgi:hypothetical protein